MKQTKEDRAETYRKDMCILDGDKVRFDSIDIGSARYVAFKAGAEWQQQQSPWISVEERMPEDNQLVLTSSGIYGTKLLVWNECHNVWDYEDGDDVYCERDKIDAWMPIPEL